MKEQRPWGWYDVIDCGERYKVKSIEVDPGSSLSLQKHYHRAEHWVVVEGTASVEVDGKMTLVFENQSAYVPFGSKHRLSNPGKIPLRIVEVQSGSYLEEDDIERFDDEYGRLDTIGIPQTNESSELATPQQEGSEEDSQTSSPPTSKGTTETL